jgi:hypothetical protein
MTYHLRIKDAQELEELKQRKNITIKEIIVDTEEVALTDYWNKNIVPGVSMLVKVSSTKGIDINNLDCMRDNDGGRMFQQNKGRFGY